MNKLINWQELSRRLAGNDSSIKADRIPQKYERKVNKLLKALAKWERKHVNKV